jgi:aerobic carbon-monoxide dehydrogenase medium subunit
MKPAPFLYAAPRSIEETLELLAQYGSDARLLAGGQSLLPMLNLRLARPAVIIDINRIPELVGWTRSQSQVSILPLTRQRELEGGLGRAVPLLRAAARHVGHVATRSRGSIGGSLAHADPAAELPACMLALDGEFRARSKRGERRIPAAKFFTGIFATALEPDELLCEILVPQHDGATAAGFAEIARRPGDFAIAGAALMLNMSHDGTVGQVQLAFAGVGETPVRIPDAEAALIGRPANASMLAEAGRIAAAAICPDPDLHATAAYRRSVVPVLVERAFADACGSAGSRSPAND